jgi:transcriptional regulator with XRE-family HTH domain
LNLILFIRDEERSVSVTTETAPVSREALRLAREQRRLSQRELGRRVARRLGRAEATRAFQVRLSRIETGDEITEEDRALVDALAAELALGEGDLATPPRYIWFKTTPEGRLSFVALGLRQIAFTSPENAYDARDALALENELAQPFRDAQLFPIHGSSLTDAVLDANFGPDLSDEEREFLIAVDPNPEELQFLWTLQVVLGGGELRDAFERGLSKVYDTGDVVTHSARLALDFPGFEAELVKLHKLALQRLKHPPAEGEHLLEAWRREEQTLFAILDRIHELRRERREESLRGEGEA